jgi:hypothetical protein
VLRGGYPSHTGPRLRGVGLPRAHGADPGALDAGPTEAPPLLRRADAWWPSAITTASTGGLALGREARVLGQYNYGALTPHGTPLGGGTWGEG